MRPFCLLLFVPVLLAACGSTERKTVIVAPAGTTVVVPSDGGDTRVVRTP